MKYVGKDSYPESRMNGHRTGKTKFDKWVQAEEKAQRIVRYLYFRVGGPDLYAVVESLLLRLARIHCDKVKLLNDNFL